MIQGVLKVIINSTCPTKHGLKFSISMKNTDMHGIVFVYVTMIALLYMYTCYECLTF